jgi:hypothetical protein
MRLETFLLAVGILVGLVGLALLLDAWIEENPVQTDRRRFRRLDGRDRKGEAMVGLGVMALGAIIIGGDEWRYSIVAGIAATLLLLWGVKRNSAYIRAGLRRS